MKLARIAIFASGSGTNAENNIEHFGKDGNISVVLLLSNKKDAYVLERVKKFGTDSVVFSNNELQNSNLIDNILSSKKVDYLILAGFLLKMPERIVDNYKGRIINIHPALLPKFGGKGMYGNNVHKAVIEAGEKRSGITIHLVDKDYDRGTILFQAECDLSVNENCDSLAEKIHRLEQLYFPLIVEGYIKSRLQ